MRFDSLMVELSATPMYLLAFFLIVTLILHVALVWWGTLDDIAWKKADYIWLSAAAIGLLVSSAQVGRYISRSYLDNLETPRMATAYQMLRDHLSQAAGLCLPRRKTEFSPPDFDQIVQEQQELCRKSKAVAAGMPPTIAASFPPLEKTGFVPFGGGAKYEAAFVRETNRLADYYRQQQKRFADFETTATLSTAEQVFTVMGPLLLAFALALRFTKVSGEISNAHAKKKA